MALGREPLARRMAAPTLPSCTSSSPHGTNAVAVRAYRVQAFALRTI